MVAPGRCYEPVVLSRGRRLWGVAVQLYTLRSESNWGIGDFADLESVVRGLRATRRLFRRPEPAACAVSVQPGAFQSLQSVVRGTS